MLFLEPTLLIGRLLHRYKFIQQIIWWYLNIIEFCCFAFTVISMDNEEPPLSLNKKMSGIVLLILHLLNYWTCFFQNPSKVGNIISDSDHVTLSQVSFSCFIIALYWVVLLVESYFCCCRVHVHYFFSCKYLLSISKQQL